MIFQDPVTGLNPVMPIGDQVAEIVQAHLHVSKRESKRTTIEALARQGLPQPERVAAAYPFQLSGGRCQRVMIAIATVLNRASSSPTSPRPLSTSPCKRRSCASSTTSRRTSARRSC
jgi:ABC-type antimicrobial peptide transport system ATPase subunit